MKLPYSVVRFVVAVVISVTITFPAMAAGLNIVRDAEIEDTIRRMATPLFEAAGLAPSSVSIHLVNDKSLNAFVANGQNLFIHTGLLMEAESASQVIGVIAHEVGHIAGGHLSRIGDAYEQSVATTMIAALMGVAAAVGTGRGDVGAAVFAGGQHVSTRNFLSFTRGQESAADQAALRFLDTTKQSADGLLSFMKILEGQELMISNNRDPYARTHPLSEERIRTIAAHIEKSPYSGENTDPALEQAFVRMRGKLRGYFQSPPVTLRQYPLGDNSIEARYARAFAYSREPNTQEALSEINSLLSDIPSDPYFLELKAQIHFDGGDVNAAIPPFREAVKALPEEPLLRGELGRVLLESTQPGALEEAVEQLKFALSRDKRSASNWRNLGIAYGRLGDIGRSSLALAEEAMLRGQDSEARYHAGRAAESFPRGSPEWLQSQDLLLALDNKKK